MTDNPRGWDYTQKPDDDRNLVEALIDERRDEDRRRHPERTNTKQVRKDVYGVLKLRKELGSKGRSAGDIRSEARRRYPELANKFPSLLKQALEHDDENLFKGVLNSILQRIELVQQNVISIEKCSEGVDAVLTQKFYRRTDS